MVATPRARDAAGLPTGSGSPSKRISPAVGSTAPETHLISVDLPAPLGPRRQWTSPSSTSRSTPCSALTPGYSLTRPLTWRIGLPAMSADHQWPQVGVGDAQALLDLLGRAAPDGILVLDGEGAGE